MKKKMVLIILVSIILIGIIVFVGYGLFFKDKEYKNLETNVEQTVARYLGQYFEEYPKSGEKKINITDVISAGYEIKMSVNDDSCEGYVVVKKVSFAYEYDGYIKCNNYVTKGYSK